MPAIEERTMYQTVNDLEHELREKMITILNKQLADLIELRTRAKVAPWNVRGSHFAELHKVFDEIEEGVDRHADMVPERAAQLGGILRGTARQVGASIQTRRILREWRTRGTRRCDCGLGGRGRIVRPRRDRRNRERRRSRERRSVHR